MLLGYFYAEQFRVLAVPFLVLSDPPKYIPCYTIISIVLMIFLCTHHARRLNLHHQAYDSNNIGYSDL